MDSFYFFLQVVIWFLVIGFIVVYTFGTFEKEAQDDSEETSHEADGMMPEMRKARRELERAIQEAKEARK